MEPFRTITGIAAPLPVGNIDTDMILAARFMKTVSRKGLGQGLFYSARFTPEGKERPDFIMNRSPWRDARILVVLANFGCGSSREHAPWALLDFGIRCVIAESFADIFYGNCFKNGILPIVLPPAEIARLLELTSEPGDAELTVDLERQVILTAGGTIPFDIDEQRRQRMLDGADDIALALRHVDEVNAHEMRVRDIAPWLDEARLDQPGITAPNTMPCISEGTTNA